MWTLATRREPVKSDGDFHGRAQVFSLHFVEGTISFEEENWTSPTVLEGQITFFLDFITMVNREMKRWYGSWLCLFSLTTGISLILGCAISKF